mmetsp:Transcript_145260/g.256081  ORF Transcript_145260/g.256081 Transcript_145260/m.256081 type:complete len:328 (-) Transcript_145260:1521-2504(-)
MSHMIRLHPCRQCVEQDLAGLGLGRGELHICQYAAREPAALHRKPRICQRILRGGALARIFLQQAQQYALRFVRCTGAASEDLDPLWREHNLPKLHPSLIIEFGKLIRTSRIQKRNDAATQQFVESGTHRPNVCLGPLLLWNVGAVLKVRKHRTQAFWGLVARIAEHDLTPVCTQRCTTVVSDHHPWYAAWTILLHDKYVVRLQVIVHAPFRVQERHSGHGLIEKACDETLGELRGLLLHCLHVFVEVPSTSQLRDYEKLILRRILQQFNHLDAVRVPEIAHLGKLCHEGLDSLRFRVLCLLGHAILLAAFTSDKVCCTLHACTELV